MQRIYLAGPMTGLPEFNYPAFHAEAARLRALGYHVENPADHGMIDGFEWADYLRLDMQKLITCEAIALLPGWDKSKGARLEYHVATELGMQVCTASQITRSIHECSTATIAGTAATAGAGLHLSNQMAHPDVGTGSSGRNPLDHSVEVGTFEPIS